MTNERRNMDDVFESLFGFRPKKRGAGFEMLVAAAVKIVRPGTQVLHDQRLRGEQSGTDYQLDAVIIGSEQTMVEAKDYTEAAKPVGRADVQKLAGALPDLEPERGALASATGFTEPAVKYAAATEGGTLGKRIGLLHVRPTVERDNEGRVKTIVIRLTINQDQYMQGKITPVISEETKRTLNELARDAPIQLPVDKFYRPDGSESCQVSDLGRRFGRVAKREAGVATGRYVFPEPTFVRTGSGVLVAFEGFEFEAPILSVTEQIIIEATGTPRILVKEEGGSVNTLVTEEQLAQVRFSEGGEVLLDGDGRQPTRVQRQQLPLPPATKPGEPETNR
jgi:hypothetical protein